MVYTVCIYKYMYTYVYSNKCIIYISNYIYIYHIQYCPPPQDHSALEERLQLPLEGVAPGRLWPSWPSWPSFIDKLTVDWHTVDARNLSFTSWGWYFLRLFTGFFFYISAGATVVSRSLNIKKRQIHKKWPDSWALPSLFQPAASTSCNSMYGEDPKCSVAMWLGFWHNHPTRLGEMEKRGRIPNILFQSKYFYGCSKNVSCAQCHGAHGFHSLWWKGCVCKKGGSAAEAWCGTKTARAFKCRLTIDRTSYDVAGAHSAQTRQPFWCNAGSPLSPSWFILRHQLFIGVSLFFESCKTYLEHSPPYFSQRPKVVPLEWMVSGLCSQLLSTTIDW